MRASVVGGVVLSLVLGVQLHVVAAKPLPASMKVFVKKGKPFLTTDKVTVQLVDNWNE